MTRKELCEMCTEYSVGVKCEHKNSCKLQAILTENSELKKENRKLKKENKELNAEISWSKYPDTMGRW